MANSNDKEKNSEHSISKSDIREIIKLLQKMEISLRELDGIKRFPYDEKGQSAIPKGELFITRYTNYYDVNNTITIAGPIDPNDFDSPVYNTERVFEFLERYAEIIEVVNDGTDTLFVIVSHGGRTNFSQEVPIFPGETKMYYNVYELRLRSPTQGLPYRITEYDIENVSQTSIIPIEKANLQNVPLPAANTNWLSSDIIPTRTPTTFRIQVAISISGDFSAVITKSGNNQVVTFNIVPGPTLIANGIYIFDLLVHSGDSINFRFSEDNGSIKILRVQEIDASTA